MSINFPASPVNNQLYTFANTTWKWDGTTWTVVSSEDVITTNGFGSIEVAGQDTIVANTFQDVLTVIEGNNVTIETDSNEKSITITSTATGGGGGQTSNSFETIAVAGQSSVVAESATDTLTLVAGSNITITTNPTNDTITITSTAAGSATFSGLSDALAASLTVNRFYMPAITALNVSNNGANAYRFDQYGNTDNPTIYAINGTTMAFNLNVSGHPFLIQTGPGVNYNTGLVHVDSTGVVSTGAAAQGKTSGTLYWKIPTEISGGYRYQCGVHAPMVGSITIKNFLTV